jgi:hypothetical protein
MATLVKHRVKGDGVFGTLAVWQLNLRRIARWWKQLSVGRERYWLLRRQSQGTAGVARIYGFVSTKSRRTVSTTARSRCYSALNWRREQDAWMACAVRTIFIGPLTEYPQCHCGEIWQMLTFIYQYLLPYSLSQPWSFDTPRWITEKLLSLNPRRSVLRAASTVISFKDNGQDCIHPVSMNINSSWISS